jgi:hypothetical protein
VHARNIFILLFTFHYPITTTILNIIHRPVFYLKTQPSETGFYFQLQVKPEAPSIGPF